jgi:hypothetical protein
LIFLPVTVNTSKAALSRFALRSMLMRGMSHARARRLGVLVGRQYEDQVLPAFIFRVASLELESDRPVPQAK